MFVNYKIDNIEAANFAYAYNGERFINVFSGGAVSGIITADVPSLKMEDLDLREITFRLLLKDGQTITDAFIVFNEGSFEAFNYDSEPYENIDSLFVTVVEREIEYCMDCQGATIIGDEPCLTCGGDGSLW